jgi:glycosyltransferase involved in cell wall biosynthesis
MVERTSEFRFAAVISHPTQHYTPFFRTLSKHTGMDVKVFYVCGHGAELSYDPGFDHAFKWDIPLLEGYKYEILEPRLVPTSFGFLEIDSRRLPAALSRYAPNVIWLHGYGHRISWRALSWARRNGAATIYFGDSELLHRRSRIALAAKRLLLPRFFSLCDGFISIGDNNRAYYEHYGVPTAKIFDGACPVELDRFEHVARTITDSEKRELRNALGLPQDSFVVLVSGKLQRHKRPIDLVRTLAEPVVPSVVYALFLGDGPMNRELILEAERIGVRERVVVTGFVNQGEVPRYLAIADALLVASERDAHPLAVTESLVFGLPIVCSNKVGCIGPGDTARENINALVYPCGDTKTLGRQIDVLVRNKTLRERMRQASKEVAQTQHMNVTVKAISRILRSVRNRYIDNWRLSEEEVSSVCEYVAD